MTKVKNIIGFAMTISVLMISCKSTQETTPQRKDIVDAVFASGYITTVNGYSVTAFTDGYLSASMITEGDSVVRNQVLFKLVNDVQQSQESNALVNYQYAQTNAADYSPQLLQVQEQINQATLKKQTDEINLRRYENLVKTNAVSKVDYENIQLTYKNDSSNIAVLQTTLATLKQNLALNEANTKAQYHIQSQNNGYYNISSTNNGLVLSVFKHNGDLIKKGETIAAIGTGEKIAKLYVDEGDIQNVQLNQQVHILLNTDKNNSYPATVSKIYPAFDQNSQSFIVQATFSKMPSTLKDGTQLQSNIIVTERKNALVIPASYYNNDSVLVKNTNLKTPVKAGIKTTEWVEIVGGLSDSQVIVLPKQK